MLGKTDLDLSQPGVRMAAQEDPDGVLATASGTVLIDEWQEAPEILGAVKRAVDADLSNTPGRFIITGSGRAAYQAATWPGTGRLIRVRMYGLTQAELNNDGVYNPIERLFSSEQLGGAASLVSRAEYVERIVAGRFPSVVGLSGRNRSRWFGGYVEQLVERDIALVAERRTQSAKVRAVLTSCAVRTGQELNRDATAKDAGVDFRTAERFISLLEDLSIVLRIPAWHTQRLKRLTRAPKVYCIDPGMAAYLLEVDAARLGRTPNVVGQLFETFVATELATHLETAAQEVRLSHVRNRDGTEVDLVLESQGRIVGIEVKSSTKVELSDARGLVWLRERLGDTFRCGVVFYSGALSFQLDERIWALPISFLWTRQQPS